jgi:hypothetical protein
MFRRQYVKAPTLYRISSFLLLLFAAAHTFGFRQNIPAWGVDAAIGLMRSVHFDAQGFTRTYWDFFSAFGFFFSAFLLFAAVLAWLLSGLPAETLARVRPLLCSSYRFELEIRLHHPSRFLSFGYSVFDCGRVALREDRLNLDWESDRPDLRRIAGKPAVIRFIRNAARWRRFFSCYLAASNFRSRWISC